MGPTWDGWQPILTGFRSGWLSEGKNELANGGVWQHPDNCEKYVIDEMRFTKGFGTLKFVVTSAGDQFHWEGCGTIKPPYFVREFKSKRLRSSVRGTFTFQMLPQGDKMVGYFTGPTTTGMPIANAGLFTCDEELVNRMRASLSAGDCTLEFTRALSPAMRMIPPLALSESKRFAN